MKPKILFLLTISGKRYVCNDGVFTGMGDSHREAYEQWEKQNRTAYYMAADISANGLPDNYLAFSRLSTKQYNRSDIMRDVDFIIRGMENGIR